MIATKVSDEWHLEHPWSRGDDGLPNDERPNAMQADLVTDEDSQVIVVHGGFRSGKTAGGTRWMVDSATFAEPGRDHAAVGLSMPMMEMPRGLIDSIERQIKALAWVDPSGRRYPFREGIDYVFRRTSPKKISFTHFGSSITMIPAGDAMLRSATFRRMWGDEVGLWHHYEDFAAFLTRLSDGAGTKAIITTTPEKSRPWFVDTIRDWCYDNPRPGWRALRASTDDAHWLDASYHQTLRLIYSTEAQKAYIHGYLVAAGSGGAYGKWSDDLVWREGDPAHLEPRPRGAYPIRISIDWGGPNFAVVIATVIPWDNDVDALRMVLREIELPPSASARDYGVAVGKLLVENEWHVGRPVWYGGDTQGGDTNLGVGKTRREYFLEGLATHGIRPIAHFLNGNPGVGDRVETVNNALEKSRVIVHHLCKRLIEDRRNVKWNASGTELDKGSDGRRTHFSDADDYDIFLEWGRHRLATSGAPIIKPGYSTDWGQEVEKSSGVDRPSRIVRIPPQRPSRFTT